MTLNCDLGEGILSESQLLDYIDRASVACGGHYGNRESIRTTIINAKEKNVPCGAHPSFPDKENFGRKPLDISMENLQDSITSQLELFLEIAQEQSIEIDHIKAHGALYNAMMEDLKMAEVLIRAREKLGISCPVFALCKSTFFTEFYTEIPLLKEAFVDRKYTSSYKLASRQLQNAVIEEPEIALSQFHAFQEQNTFLSIDKTVLFLAPDTVCIHGDNPAALSILKHIKEG